MTRLSGRFVLGPSEVEFAATGPAVASGSGPSRSPGTIFPFLSTRSGGDRPGSRPEEAAGPVQDGNDLKSAKSTFETSNQPQPSAGGRVPEDMATLVLDNPALGASGAQRPGAIPDPARENYAHDESSDAAFMLRVAAGDESGFNYLAGKYHRAMISFLFRMVRNQAVAEELAQEVFLRVYRSRESYRAEAKFTTWLYRIATNLAVNHARDTGTSVRRRLYIWTLRTRRQAPRRMWPTMN